MNIKTVLFSPKKLKSAFPTVDLLNLYPEIIGKIAISLPGVILHESSHLMMAVLLNVKFTVDEIKVCDFIDEKKPTDGVYLLLMSCTLYGMRQAPRHHRMITIAPLYTHMVAIILYTLLFFFFLGAGCLTGVIITGFLMLTTVVASKSYSLSDTDRKAISIVDNYLAELKLSE